MYSASEGALSGYVYKLHCLLVDADMLTSDSQLFVFGDVIKYFLKYKLETLVVLEYFPLMQL